MTVYGGTTAQDFTLTVGLAVRVKFKEGKTSAAVSGYSPDGSAMVYSVFALEGQKMSLGVPGGDAALGVVGWADTQTYLDPATQKYKMSLRLPLTQDYIVTVVPRHGKPVHFVLSIEIQ